MDCSAIELTGQLDSPKRQALKDCLELVNLKREAERRSWLPWAPTPEEATLFAGLAALLAAGIGYLIKHRNEKMRLAVEIEEGRRKHLENRIDNWRLDLSGSNPISQRLAIVGMIRVARDKGLNSDLSVDGSTDAKLLVTALLASISSRHLHSSVRKYVADELRPFFRSKKKLAANGKAAKGAGAADEAPFLMKDFNLQCVRPYDAWWAEVDASGTDFFDANLCKVSFRDADLSGAKFRGTRLRATQFNGADMSGADLRGAHLEGAFLAGSNNLDGAKFNDQTTWDLSTTWPSGFDLVKHGLAPHPTPPKLKDQPPPVA